MSELYIGLMSGTSVDAIDAVLMDFSKSSSHIVETFSQELNTDLKDKINSAIAKNSWPQDVVDIDHEFALASVEAVNSLLAKASIFAEHVAAIGSHGQTIWHQPNGIPSCSIQIGNAQLIAKETGIQTISNFRQADIDAGGQGAPLACAYHAEILRSDTENRIILNLGGIANITYLPSDTSKDIIGFDTGPANTLLDAWIKKHKNLDFDQDGIWAKSGHVNTGLLNIMLKELYFRQPPPKSTGRERFNLVWLQYMLDQYEEFVIEKDVQATLVALTALTIKDAIKKYTSSANRILVCGGGSKNTYLLSQLQNKLGDIPVEPTNSFGVPEKWMEAMTFAWLAKRNLENKPGNLPTVTGATKVVTLGESFLPK